MPPSRTKERRKCNYFNPSVRSEAQEKCTIKRISRYLDSVVTSFPLLSLSGALDKYRNCFVIQWYQCPWSYLSVHRAWLLCAYFVQSPTDRSIIANDAMKAAIDNRCSLDSMRDRCIIGSIAVQPERDERNSLSADYRNVSSARLLADRLSEMALTYSLESIFTI